MRCKARDRRGHGGATIKRNHFEAPQGDDWFNRDGRFEPRTEFDQPVGLQQNVPILQQWEVGAFLHDLVMPRTEHREASCSHLIDM